MFWLNVVLIVVSVLLIITVLLQQRGAGLSATLGGEGNVYYAKRGAEKMIFIATIVLSVLFVGTAFARLFF
ncbi:preprotein translocase subunit SecG [Candidatus Azambacteria bacterium]|nr:preprotein translocase subunit SecG [Candidatus Azambacteria bacterium]